MKTYFYIQHKLYFKCTTVKDAVKKAVKHISDIKSSRHKFNISIKDLKTKKIYKYTALKGPNKKIVIKRQMKKHGGTLYKDGDEVVLYDLKNHGYITGYEPGEVEDPLRRRSSGYVYGKEYKLSDTITPNSVFILRMYLGMVPLLHYQFQLKNAPDKYRWLNIQATSSSMGYFLCENIDSFGIEESDDTLISGPETPSKMKLPKIKVIPYMNMLDFSRKKEENGTKTRTYMLSKKLSQHTKKS